MPEFNRDDWFDVFRQFKPDATREDFDAVWDDFQRIKEERERQKRVQ